MELQIGKPGQSLPATEPKKTTGSVTSDYVREKLELPGRLARGYSTRTYNPQGSLLNDGTNGVYKIPQQVESGKPTIEEYEESICLNPKLFLEGIGYLGGNIPGVRQAASKAKNESRILQSVGTV